MFFHSSPWIFYQEIHDPIDAAAHQLREAQKKQVIATSGKSYHRLAWGKAKANHIGQSFHGVYHY